MMSTFRVLQACWNAFSEPGLTASKSYVSAGGDPRICNKDGSSAVTVSLRMTLSGRLLGVAGTSSTIWLSSGAALRLAFFTRETSSFNATLSYPYSESLSNILPMHFLSPSVGTFRSLKQLPLRAISLVIKIIQSQVIVSR